MASEGKPLTDDDVDGAPEEEPAATDPVGRVTRVVGALVILSFAWYLIADRFTPSTSQARVSGYVIPIVPQVSGVVTEVSVGLNQIVSAGDVLVRIDPEPYELAVENAEAELARAGQAIGADTDGVSAAEARVAEAVAGLDAARRTDERIRALEAEGVSSPARADRARADLEASRARVANARAELERARSQLGVHGTENPRLRSAVAALRRARIDLARTTLTAPTDGGVTNVRVDIGRYAGAGQPIMTFISTTDVWVEAHLRENNLTHVKAGDRARIVLDVAPGRIFEGVVVSTGFGVKWSKGARPGELPTVSSSRDWLRDPQRFPVIIGFANDETRGLRREGGQADVIIFTGDNFVLNGFGSLWIRMVSLLSYGQ